MYMINPDGIEQGVIRLADKVWIPACIGNRDWDAYLIWVSEDNEPIPWDIGYGE